MRVVDTVRDLFAPLVAAEGLELYDIEHAGGVLRVSVDHPDGVSLDVIARLTRAINRLIEDDDPVPGRYTLEVSSPGLERPLRTPEHFTKAIGEDVNLKMVPTYDGDRRVKGRLTAVGEGSVTVVTERGELQVVQGDIAKATTVFEWGPAPKPGQGEPRQKNAARSKKTGPSGRGAGTGGANPDERARAGSK